MKKYNDDRIENTRLFHLVIISGTIKRNNKNYISIMGQSE